MKSHEQKTGLTLVETLVVVAIIAILTTIVINITTRIDNQAKEQLAESTIAILTNALEQFHDYGYRYKDPAYSEFDFPLDCNGFNKADLEAVLFDAMDATGVLIAPVDAAKPISHTEPSLSGCEVMYFLLSQVPACKETLDKIDKSLLTDKDVNGNSMKITINSRDYPLLRIIDPWGKTLHYDYYYEYAPDPDSKRTFPVITSAGPDGNFGTVDDVTSK